MNDTNPLVALAVMIGIVYVGTKVFGGGEVMPAGAEYEYEREHDEPYYVEWERNDGTLERSERGFHSLAQAIRSAKYLRRTRHTETYVSRSSDGESLYHYYTDGSGGRVER